MNCMKCGREIALGQAFCKDCLEDMSHYPVSPGTPIQIPPQPTSPPARRNAHPKKIKKPEEQVIRLRRLLRLQNITVLILTILLIGLGIYTVTQLQPTAQPFRPGENYVTTETPQPSIPTIPNR